MLGGDGEEVPPVPALAGDEVGERLRAAGADLDLGVDQLAAERVGERLVRLRRVAELNEAMCEVERRRIEDRELLLEGAGEIRGLLEPLAGQIEVEAPVTSHGHRCRL